MIDKWGKDWGKQEVIIFSKVLFIVDIKNQEHKDVINRLKKVRKYNGEISIRRFINFWW